MQQTDFEISSDGKSVHINGQTFRALAGEHECLRRCGETGKLIWITEYPGLTSEKVTETRQQIKRDFIMNLSENPESSAKLEEQEVEEQVEVIRRDFHRLSHNISLPDMFTEVRQPDGSVTVYVCHMLPPDFLTDYCTVSRSVSDRRFALPTRIYTAMQIAELIWDLERCFRNMICRIEPEDLYINVKSGEILFIAGRCFDRNDPPLPDAPEDYTFMHMRGETPGSLIGELELLRFEVYTAFQLLCQVDPFDGKRAIVEFPLLTKYTAMQMHSSDCGFIFGNTGNQMSDWGDKMAYARYSLLPRFIRDAFRLELDNPMLCDAHVNPHEWLKLMRRLRDCLCYVNGNFRFFDPDKPSSVLLLETDVYTIPIWPKKAVYNYHLKLEGIPSSDVIIGVTTDCKLYNNTAIIWKVIYMGKTHMIPEHREFTPKPGMTIQINDVTVRVTSAAKGTDDVNNDSAGYENAVISTTQPADAAETGSTQ